MNTLRKTGRLLGGLLLLSACTPSYARVDYGPDYYDRRVVDLYANDPYFRSEYSQKNWPIAGRSAAAFGLHPQLRQGGLRARLLRSPRGRSLRQRPLLLRRLALLLPELESGRHLRVRRPLLPQSLPGLAPRAGVSRSQGVLSASARPGLGPGRPALR